MEISNTIIFGVIEIWAAVLGLVFFLLFQTRNLKNLVRSLQEKLQGLITDLKTSKATCKKLQKDIAQQASSGGSYLRQLNDQLLHTKKFHLDLGDGTPIEEDFSGTVSEPNHVAAFRHAYLAAEKNSLELSDSDTPDWLHLNNQIVELLSKVGGSDGDSEATKKRLANLEKFKKLFFDMEDKWTSSQKQAEEYYNQLLAYADATDDPEAFKGLLDQLNNAYSDLASSFDSPPDTSSSKVSVIEVSSGEPRSNAELDRLRDLSQTQNAVIEDLQKRLVSASTDAEKDLLIQDLNNELKKQQRFIQESDTCVQLMEQELDQTMDQVHHLEQRIKENTDKIQQIPELKKAVDKLDKERKEQKTKMKLLKDENKQLINQLEMNESPTASSGSSNNKELQELQDRYTELEERYLDLKMKDM